MGNFESYIDIIEMVADAIDGDEKAMRDTIEHLTGERPGDDARFSDLRVASTFAIFGWPLAFEVDGTSLEVTLPTDGPRVRLTRETFNWSDEMKYAGAGRPPLTYGGMSVTTILDFFREVVGPEDDDALDF